MPMGVTSCSGRIVDAFQSRDFDKTFFHGHSFTANPLACAAANASLELLLREDCQVRISSISLLHQEFQRSIQTHRRVKNVRTLGTMIAIELDTEESTAYTNSVRKKIYPFFLQKGILLRPLGNVIYILPPYVITSDELRSIYAAIQEFLDQWK